MPSQIEICNSGLIKIGSERINAITQDAKRAIALNAIWDQCRDYVLRAHPWNFALKRVTLTPTATTPEWGYQYEYALPNDFLRLWQTDPEDIEFNIESDSTGALRVLRTDETDLDVLYIWQNDNPAMWDSIMAEALSWYLGAQISYSLFQSLSLQDFAMKKYREVLSEAKAADGQEGTMRTLESTQFVDSRRSGRSFNGKV